MKFRLFHRNDIVSASDLSLSRWERLRRNFGAFLSSVALASTFGLAVPGIAHAEEGVADTNTTPEMTYEMSNDEVSEITDGSFSETVTADVTDYSESNTSETSYVDESASTEQTVVEENAPAEQASVEESAPAEQAAVEENAPAEQTAEEVSGAEQVTNEGSAEVSESAESTNADVTLNVGDLSAVESSSTHGESSVSSGSYEESSSTVSTGSEYVETETVTEGSASFTVEEVDGKFIMITSRGDSELSEKMLAEMVEDWRTEHNISSEADVVIFNIYGQDPGRYDLEGVNAQVIINNDHTVTIVKKENSKSEPFEETVVAQVPEENTEAQVTEGTKTDVQDKQDSTEKQNEINSKTIAYNDTDYVVVTGKDGSVTIVTMLPLNAEKVMKIKNDLIKSGKMSNNTPMNLKTLVQNGETIIGNSVLTRGKDGSLGIIGSDFESIEALNDKEIADYISERNEKDKNGHIDGKEVKPDNPDKKIPPVEPEKEEIPPVEPDKPNKEIPPVEPNEPGKPNEPGNPNREETHAEYLPKTGDPFNPLAAGAVAAAGLGAIATGIGKRRKDNKYSDEDLDDDFDIDPVLNNPEYQADAAIVDRAKHFTDDQKDKIKDEIYKEYSSQIENDSKKGPKHLAK